MPIADSKCSLELRSSNGGASPERGLPTVRDARGHLPARLILGLEATVQCSVFILDEFLLLLAVVGFLLGSLSVYRDKGKIHSSMFVSVFVSYCFCHRNNDLKLSDLEQHTFIFLPFQRPEVQTGPPCAQARLSAGLITSPSSRGKSLGESLPPGLFHPLRARSMTSPNVSQILLPPPSIYRDSCDYSGPTWVIQDCLPSRRSDD